MLYWVLKVVLTPILRVCFRPWVEGAEHLPTEGGAILASNHLSFSDSIFLPLVVPRKITFLAKSDYFTGKGVKGALTKHVMRGAGQVPIDRSGGVASEGAIRTAMQVLRRGQLLGLYPEGTRSPDGRLYRGKTGIARMSLEAGVTVIPVAMIDTDVVQPTGQVIPKLGRIGVRIGRPLDFSRYAGMEDDRFVLRSITDEIMYELMLLSGQEYVDQYAAKAKEDAAKAKADAAKPKADAAKAKADAAKPKADAAKAKSDAAKKPGAAKKPDAATATQPATASDAAPAERSGPADQPGSSGQRRAS